MLHCFYEAQEPSLCKLVFSRECIELDSALNPVDYLAIGYFVTSLLSVPSSDTSNILLNIRNIVDKYSLKLLLLELSKYPIGEASGRRLEITVKLLGRSINNFSLQIYEGLQHNSALVLLNLFITVESLTTMLQVNKTLTHLNLSKNKKLSDSGACCIFQGLQHNTTLVHLNLNNTRLVVNTEDTAEALITMLQVNKTLTHLDLSENWNFLDSGAYCFFLGLQHNTSLVHLNLSCTGLVATEDTARAVTRIFQVNKTIQHLDVSLNWNFSDAGVDCICQGLQHNTTLVYLNLSDTRITDKGAKYIAQALESNRSLQTLNISNNRITDNGFACIENSLKSNTTLRLNRFRLIQ